MKPSYFSRPIQSDRTRHDYGHTRLGHANDNPRPRFRDVMRDRGGLLFAAIMIVAVGVVMASHGVLR